MSEQKSTLVFASAREAQQKFDYFVTGVAGALFAYIAQTYTPKKIAFTPAALEPLGLICLALAFYFGMRRIEKTMIVMRLNHEMLDFQEKAGNMTQALAQASGPGFNLHTGEFVQFHELSARREEYMRKAQWAQSEAELASSAAERHYSRRNLFLFAGFVAIFLAKLLLPYA